jgi:hypothetical protein
MLNLYFNCHIQKYDIKQYLHNRPGINLDETGIDDSKKNLSILKATIYSYSKLNFNKLYFNISLDSFFSEKDFEDIKNYINFYFGYKDINLKINLSRPNNFKEWLKNSEEIIEFFDEYPVLYIFNHDHIFSASETLIFYKLLNEYHEKTKNYDNHIWCIYHNPEYCSASINLNHFKNRIFYQNWFVDIEEKDRNESFKIFKVTNFCEGNFISSKKFGKYLWSKIKNDLKNTYIYKPDQGNMKFSDLELNYWVANEELFRHFEGYSHVSNLYKYDYSFDVETISDKVQIKCPRIKVGYKYKPLIFDLINHDNDKINLQISDDSEYLVRLYYIAFRDYVFNQLIVLNKTVDIKFFVKEIISHYTTSNYNILNITEIKKMKLFLEITKHFSENLHLFISDCLSIIGNSEDFTSYGSVNLIKQKVNSNLKKKNFLDFILYRLELKKIIKRFQRIFK